MNDRFKFRVWNKENNKYEDDLYYEAGDLQVNCVNKIFEEYISDGCIVEQCTGLKDKNGKLIYEGDIIDCKPFYTKRKVIWIDKDCRFNISSSIRVNDAGYERETEIMEVIGNIHENADLLENEECYFKKLREETK